MSDYKREMTRHESITQGRVDPAGINAALLFDQVSMLQQEVERWKGYCGALELKVRSLNEHNDSLLSRLAILEDVRSIMLTFRNFCDIGLLVTAIEVNAVSVSVSSSGSRPPALLCLMWKDVL
jgi:hypothetical protein